MAVTTNYNLPLYESEDKPNLRDQYNGAINMIDGLLLTANSEITELKQQMQELNQKIESLQTGTTYDDLKTHGFLYE